MEKKKKELISRILDIEVDMFLRVPTAEEPSCRSHMEDMKLHRSGQLFSWSEATCDSYLQDLQAAVEKGENLMTIKYARMDNLVPPRSDNPLITKITEKYALWQEEILKDFPNVMRGGRDMEGFRLYFSCELETCSDRTLELLWNDVNDALLKGVNMSGSVYKYLARQAGYETLEAMEESLKR